MVDAYPIFPFYLVVDASGSMEDSVSAINDELPILKREIANDPIVGDIARFAVISFNEQVALDLPLSDLLHVSEMPKIRATGPTNYGAVFQFLAGCIPHDLDWYKGQGFKMYRPVVFFITDGLPSYDDWEVHYEALVDETARYRPNMVTFGFGHAEPAVLSKVATFKAYAADEGAQPTKVLQEIARELTKSIVASSQRAAHGEAVISMPKHIDGMHELPVDLV